MHVGSVLLVLILSCGGQAAAQTGYVAIQVKNPGMIVGTVHWIGTVPRIPRMPITKNASVCDPDGQKIRDLERLLIGNDGGVENTVVYLRNITKGKAMDLPPQREHLDQKNCRYIPHILLVPQGGSLEIKSDDPILHTVHMSGAVTGNIPFPLRDQEQAAKMPRAGVVNLKCNAGHVWMNAEVIVAKNPYYAVTDEEGRFKLTDVPPREYEIEAWHEGWSVIFEEKVLDVASQVEVHRPVYSESLTWVKRVTVRAGQTSQVDFSIGERNE